MKIGKVVASQIIDKEDALRDEAISKLLYDVLGEFDNLSQIVHQGDRVLIKPNLVAPNPKATANITILEGLIQMILKAGGEPVIAESSGMEFSTESTFRILKLDELCEKYHIRLLDLDQEPYVEVDSGNPHVPIYKISSIVYQVDKIINVPCLKGHALTKVTFGIKNLFGLLDRDTRRRIHATDLEAGIAVLGKLISVDLTIVDGLWNLTSAVFGAVNFQGILVAGNSLFHVDKLCCELFGVDYLDIPHIKAMENHCECEKKILTEIIPVTNNIYEKLDSFKKRNQLYKIVYQIDTLYNIIFHKTIIPWCHYYFGIRPFINRKKCTKCGKCISVCPNNAIEDYKILSSRCMKSRCFKCFEICHFGAVEKKGFHKNV